MRKQTRLSIETNPIIAPLLAGLSGVALAFSLFPAGLILGLPSYWDSVGGDNAANWIGYLAFAKDAWRWPLFQTQLAAPPTGVNILFTDPIPLLALLGKTIFKATGYLPNYFGYWLLASYAFQAVSAYALLRVLDLGRTTALLGSLLFLLLPAFIFRYGHFPLVSHWVIIVSLILHMRMRALRSARPLLAGGLFNLVMLLINPYLLAMTLALYLAMLADAARLRLIGPAKAAALACGVIVSLVVGALTFGFIGYTGANVAVGGFGNFSMNLLSPIWPQLSAWPGQSTFILDATGGQYEGFNYLGFGILLLLLAAVTTAPRQVFAFVKSSPALIATAVAMALFSLSSRIYAGQVLLLSVPLKQFPPLEKLAEIFRSSGRFFWPLAYVLLLVGIVALHRRVGNRRLAIFVGALVLVQWIDVRPLFDSVSHRAAAAPRAIPNEIWRKAIAQHDELVIFPQFVCNKPAHYAVAYSLQMIAADLATPTNSVMINRTDADCAADAVATSRNLRALATRSDPLVVIFHDGFNANYLARAGGAAGMICKDGGFAYICSGSVDPETLNLGTALAPLPTVRAGVALEVGPGKPGEPFLGYGWTNAGPRFVWGAGSDASLSITMAEPVCGRVTLKLRILPYSADAHKVDRARITVNAGTAVEYTLASMAEGDLDVSLQDSGCARQFDVLFAFSGLRSPQELGFGSDPRRLSWALAAFSVDVSP